VQATPREVKITIQGEGLGKEEIQTITLDNCSGKSDLTRVERRSQSVDVTVSEEMAARLGASVEVISAEVQLSVGKAMTQKGERSSEIHLTAPPRTHMVFQVVWSGNEQLGYVENLFGSSIPIAFRGFAPEDVRIKSQSDIGCEDVGTSRPLVSGKVCTVPLLVGTSLREAEGLISSLGLQMNKSVQYDKVPLNQIVSQLPPAETKLDPCEGEVRVVVSLGPTPPPATSTPVPQWVTVPANVQWTDMHVTLEAGKAYQIAAEGTWMGCNTYQYKGADGCGQSPCSAYNPDVPLLNADCLALIGKIGSSGIVFFVGQSAQIVAPQTGSLFLGPNDSSWGLESNKGTLQVRVTQQP